MFINFKDFFEKRSDYIGRIFTIKHKDTDEFCRGILKCILHRQDERYIILLLDDFNDWHILISDKIEELKLHL